MAEAWKMEDDCIHSELGEDRTIPTLPSKKPSNILDNVKDLVMILFICSAIILIALIIIYCYKNIYWKPYDDASNHLLTKYDYWNSVYCEGNSCNITFDSNVSDVAQIAGTGSDVPLVGFNDVVICLNTTPKIGELVTVDNIIHLVYSYDGGFIETRGYNNQVADNFKFPANQVNCVVAAILR